MNQANLEQALADLKDLALPEPSFQWPAMGWWMLGLLVTGLLIWLTPKLVKTWQDYQQKKTMSLALQALIARKSTSDSQWLGELGVWFKRVALSYYPRTQVAHLDGQAWLAFLDQSSGSAANAKNPCNEFTRGDGQVLGHDRFKPQAKRGSPSFKPACKKMAEGSAICAFQLKEITSMFSLLNWPILLLLPLPWLFRHWMPKQKSTALL